MVLFGFLPVLVFASGLNANVHIFFKVFSQCILLAGPGVALGAFLTAVIVRYAPPTTRSMSAVSTSCAP